MSRRSDRVLLQDMLSAARQGHEAIAGKTIADLESNPVWALGLVKLLEIIGEAADRLSPATRARCPEVPWSRIVGMRHRLVHAYHDIDYEQVWSTLANDLPALGARIEQLLGDSSLGL